MTATVCGYHAVESKVTFLANPFESGRHVLRCGDDSDCMETGNCSEPQEELFFHGKELVLG